MDRLSLAAVAGRDGAFGAFGGDFTRFGTGETVLAWRRGVVLVGPICRNGFTPVVPPDEG